MIEFRQEDMNQAAEQVITKQTLQLHLAEQMIMTMQQKIDELQALLERQVEMQDSDNGHKPIEGELVSPVEG